MTNPIREESNTNQKAGKIRDLRKQIYSKQLKCAYWELENWKVELGAATDEDLG